MIKMYWIFEKVNDRLKELGECLLGLSRSDAVESAREKFHITGELIELEDTPVAYSGFGGYIVQVKATEDGVQFTTVSGVAGVDIIKGLTGVVYMEGVDVGITTSGQTIVVSGAVPHYHDFSHEKDGYDEISISGLGGVLFVIRIFIPIPLAIFATFMPIFPNPIKPKILPFRMKPFISFLSHFPSFMEWSAIQIL